MRPLKEEVAGGAARVDSALAWRVRASAWRDGKVLGGAPRRALDVLGRSEMELIYPSGFGRVGGLLRAGWSDVGEVTVLLDIDMVGLG